MMPRLKGRARTNPNPAISEPDVDYISFPHPIIVATYATSLILVIMPSITKVQAVCIFVAMLVLTKLLHCIWIAALDLWMYNEMWEQQSELRRKELREPKKPRISRTLNARVRRDRNKTV